MKIAKLIDADNYVVNAGSDQDLHIGDKVVIYLLGDEVFDPETGKSLGVLELPKQHCHVTHVQDNMAILRSDDARPKGASGGFVSTVSMLEVLGGRVGDSSPYNFLTTEQRKVVVGDQVRKVEK
jgi:hypothetical protein